MFNYLSSIVGTSKTGLNFNIGEPLGDAWTSWKHFRGTTKVRISSLDSKLARYGSGVVREN